MVFERIKALALILLFFCNVKKIFSQKFFGFSLNWKMPYLRYFCHNYSDLNFFENLRLSKFRPLDKIKFHAYNWKSNRGRQRTS